MSKPNPITQHRIGTGSGLLSITEFLQRKKGACEGTYVRNEPDFAGQYRALIILAGDPKDPHVVTGAIKTILDGLDAARARHRATVEVLDDMAKSFDTLEYAVAKVTASVDAILAGTEPPTK